MKVILAVTNDIATDNRVHKISTTLMRNGYEVEVVGRMRKGSFSVSGRSYNSKRFKLWFNKGPLFYFNYNLALLFYLLKQNCKLFVANDLDTLPACFLAAKIKKAELVFDSHEYFTEVPELVNRKRVQKIWKTMEKWIVPRLKHAYTVSNLISETYYNEYKVTFEVIKNAAYFRFDNEFTPKKTTKDKRIILYQGALNKGRGLEAIIEAMKYIDNGLLQIAGSGDLEDQLHKLVNYNGLASKIQFLGKLSYNKLWDYTQHADIGLSIEEDMGMNYRFALPNKLFDYIQARVPVLVADLLEMKHVVEKYNIGEVVTYREPELLAEQIKRMLNDGVQYAKWKLNLEIAARELSWQREEEKLVHIFRKARMAAVGY